VKNLLPMPRIDLQFLILLICSIVTILNMLSKGVKGSRLGCTGVTVLPRGNTGGRLGGSSYSPGVTDAECSLSSPKTVCAWRRAISYER
jgi:hypothetical protein